MVALGIVFLLVSLLAALGWGCYSYSYKKSEGTDEKKAMFFGMSRGVSLFIALMGFLKIENGFLSGVDVVHNINDVNIANGGESFSSGDFSGSVLWILGAISVGAISIGILAPEVLPLLFSAL